MKEVTLNTRDQQRLSVIHELGCRTLTGKQAAAMLGVSVRQVRRILAAYRKEGVAALPHGNRGRHSQHTLSAAVKERVLALARKRYAGANHCHLTDVLAEREGLVLSRSSIRRILQEAGLVSPRRRRTPAHRLRRERFPKEGMLLQIDGSRHDWLQGRGPELTLLAVIDDATSTIPAAVFWDKEDHWGYIHLLRQVAMQKGLPLALYADRHAIFWPGMLASEGLERPRREQTQVGAMLQALGIRLIYAHSPEGKGRIERWWGTCQDRLVRELAWAQAASKEEANVVLSKFLSDHNGRFGERAPEPGLAYRAWPAELDPEQIFCLKERRVVARDNTVRWRGQTWQLLPPQDHRGYARRSIEVQESQGGRVAMVHEGTSIAFARIPARRKRTAA